MNNTLKLAIGSDHAGFELKQQLLTSFQQINFKDFGCYSLESVDYPDFAHPVALAVEQGIFPLGILICGSANGVAIAANKHQGIRAALCWTPELAQLARAHNDANILCLPARFISKEDAFAIVESFLTTPFEGGRHAQRVDKIGL